MFEKPKQHMKIQTLEGAYQQQSTKIDYKPVDRQYTIIFNGFIRLIASWEGKNGCNKFVETSQFSRDKNYYPNTYLQTIE